MFSIQHQETILESSIWEKDRLELAYIEARSYTGIATASSANYRYDGLDDSEVEDWLAQRGRFAWPVDTPRADGGIRLLICERLGWKPLGFSMSKQSFLAVKKAFNLPSETLSILSSNSGENYCHFRFTSTNNDSPESFGKSGEPFWCTELMLLIEMGLKVPQMFQLGNCGLVLSHSFQTGITSAFLHGWSTIGDKNHVTDESMIPHGEIIHELVRSKVSLWGHPMLLPVSLLEEHLIQARSFQTRELAQITTNIEDALGMISTGHLYSAGRSRANEVREFMADEDRRLRLIGDLNSTTTDSISFIGKLKWDLRQFRSLHRTCDEIHKFFPDRFIRPGRSLKEIIDALDCSASSELEFAEVLRSRLELQLSVLYNLVAQTDSSLNARLAASTGLDSAAMKALAFVTTVFLPPTYVATLFSMSMFDWQASSGGDSGQTVTPRFWIYWVATIPLTLSVLLGWRVWWRFQKQYYQHKYPHARQEEDSMANLMFEDARKCFTELRRRNGRES